VKTIHVLCNAITITQYYLLTHNTFIMTITASITNAQIFSAIESISGKFITCFNDESNGYSFKYTDGTWGKAGYDFVHDIAKSYYPNGKRKPNIF